MSTLNLGTAAEVPKGQAPPRSMEPKSIEQVPDAMGAQPSAEAPLSLNRSLRSITMTTPRWLRLGGVSIGAIALLLAAMGLSTLRNQHRAIQVLSQEVATSILTTQRIEESLAALDTNLVNLLLLPADQQSEAQQSFEAHQQKIAHDLVRLAQSSEQGQGSARPGQTRFQERRAIALLQSEFGRYLREAERAQTQRQAGRQPQALLTYQQAHQRLETRLLPAATALRITKNQTLDAVYHPLEQQVTEGRLMLQLLGAALLLYLVLLQAFLSVRTRRTFNLGLLLASATVLGLGLRVSQALEQSEQQLSQAKRRTFSSLQTLRISRNLAYRGHSSLNRQLLEPQNTASAAAAFRNQMAQLIGLEIDEAQLDAIAQSTAPMPPGLLGLSSTPVNFDEEQEAMRSVVQAFLDYQNIAATVQRQEIPSAAIALATGYRNGQLNAAFEAFKSQQQSVIDIHQAAFDQSLSQSQSDIDELGWQIAVGMLLAIGLTSAGLYPRLREYP